MSELLLIDDLQFFLGKKTTMGELQNTVDFFLRDRRQLVLAADRSPAELTGMSQELRGRISGGLVCQLNYPELETRRRMIRNSRPSKGTQSPTTWLSYGGESISGRCPATCRSAESPPRPLNRPTVAR
jgi:chromosomal replication initiator protein